MIKEVQVFNNTKVTLEDTWGDEARILDTARLSASDKLVEGKELTERDTSLLKLLWEEQHLTPFETMQFRWRIEMPIFTARHFVKHRISSWNETSKRYRGGVSDFYIPEGEALEVDGFSVMDEHDIEDYFDAINSINTIREEGLARSYARIEVARSNGVLPTDTKDGRDPWRARSRELWRGLETVAEQTTIIWTLNYRSLANVFNLRLAEGAQYETRKIAEAMFECFEGAYPLLAGMYKEG